MTAVLAWPSHVVVVDDDREALMRGRPTEFRRSGLHLTHADGAFEVLASLGREPAAAIVVPATMAPDLAQQLVETVQSLTGTRVLIGVRNGSEAAAWADLLRRPDVGLVDLPLTPAGLSAVLGARAQTGAAERHEYACGELVLSGEEHRVQWHGKSVHLAPRSFAVLELLMAEAPSVVGVDEILQRVRPNHGEDWNVLGVRSAVKAIRRELRAAVPDAPVPLQVVYGIGYRVAS